MTAPELSLAYTKQSLDTLGRLSKKVRAQIISKIQDLGLNPFPLGTKLVKGRKLGLDPIHRIRSGDYRVLYAVQADLKRILVLDIGHRKDVYR